MQDNVQIAKNRNYWIDLVRVIMAFFVIGVHTTRQTGWGADLNQPLVAFDSSLFRPAVTFFLICTSYFLYDHFLASGRKPSVFFKSGLRYFVMYLFWIVLYLGIILRETWVGKGKGAGEYTSWFFQELFLNAPISVFWFMRASAFGLLLLGLFFCIKKMKPIYLLPLALILYTLGALGDSYYNFLSPNIQSIYQSYFKIFYYSRNMMFDAFPTFGVGCLLREYQAKIPDTKKANIIIWSVAAVGLALVFLESWTISRFVKLKDYNVAFSFLVFVPALFLGLSRIKKPLKWKIAPYLGDVSSLLYFTHIAFRDLYNDVFVNTPYASNWHLRFFLVSLFALMLSCAIVASTHSSKIKKWIY